MNVYEVYVPPVVVEKIKQHAMTIALDKPAVALDWYDKVFDKMLTLETMPNGCPLAPENVFVKYEVRQLIFGNYRILFRVTESSVRVLEFGSRWQNTLA